MIMRGASFRRPFEIGPTSILGDEVEGHRIDVQRQAEKRSLHECRLSLGGSVFEVAVAEAVGQSPDRRLDRRRVARTKDT